MLDEESFKKRLEEYWQANKKAETIVNVILDYYEVDKHCVFRKRRGGNTNKYMMQIRKMVVHVAHGIYGLPPKITAKHIKVHRSNMKKFSEEMSMWVSCNKRLHSDLENIREMLRVKFNDNN